MRTREEVRDELEVMRDKTAKLPEVAAVAELMTHTELLLDIRDLLEKIYEFRH